MDITNENKITFITKKLRFIKMFDYKIQKFNIHQYFRYLYDKLRRAKVVYMFVDKIAVGFCLLARGGSRYKFASNKDLIISPIFIKEDFRGKGYGTILLEEVVNKYNKNLYAVIDPSNISSLKIHKQKGFIHVNNLSTKGVITKFYINENGYLQLFLKKKKEQ